MDKTTNYFDFIDDMMKMDLSAENKDVMNETLLHIAALMSGIINKGTNTKNGVTFNLKRLPILDRRVLTTYKSIQAAIWSQEAPNQGLVNTIATNLFEIYCHITFLDYPLIEDGYSQVDENLTLSDDEISLINEMFPVFDEEFAMGA